MKSNIYFFYIKFADNEFIKKTDIVQNHRHIYGTLYYYLKC